MTNNISSNFSLNVLPVTTTTSAGGATQTQTNSPFSALMATGNTATLQNVIANTPTPTQPSSAIDQMSTLGSNSNTATAAAQAAYVPFSGVPTTADQITTIEKSNTYKQIAEATTSATSATAIPQATLEALSSATMIDPLNPGAGAKPASKQAMLDILQSDVTSGYIDQTTFNQLSQVINSNSISDLQSSFYVLYSNDLQQANQSTVFQNESDSYNNADADCQQEDQDMQKALDAANKAVNGLDDDDDSGDAGDDDYGSSDFSDASNGASTSSDSV